MQNDNLKLILEALLVSAENPLTLEQMQQAFYEWDQPTVQAIELALDSLKQDYTDRAFEIKKLATGFCLQTKMYYAQWISRIQAERPNRYSKALLETLAIIAYRQPVTRADIEDIRGVAVSSSMIKTLLEREWIRVAGHKDVPGKPSVYVTTNVFLDYFNLSSLKELPAIILESEAEPA